MLPFRLAIVTAVAALCLWGLFSLLDSLQEPGLLRSEKVTVVKGCDSVDSDEAREQCPALFCQKALLDAKLVPLQSRFGVSVDGQYEDGERVIAGQVINKDSPVSHFACSLAGTRVTSANLIDRAQLQQLDEDPQFHSGHTAPTQ